MIRRWHPFWLVLLLLVASLSCTAPQGAKQWMPEGELAVASFHQPRHDWELLGSSEKVSGQEVPEQHLKELTQKLLQELEKRGFTSLSGPESVAGCREIVLSREAVSPQSARQYWASVGRCVPAGAILVPQLTHWRQREGGPWGVENPASVALRLVLLDPEQEEVLRFFQFREEQKSLSENLLEIGNFIRRGGQWLRAEDLAAEGIRRGLKDMGL